MNADMIVALKIPETYTDEREIRVRRREWAEKVEGILRPRLLPLDWTAEGRLVDDLAELCLAAYLEGRGDDPELPVRLADELDKLRAIADALAEQAHNLQDGDKPAKRGELGRASGAWSVRLRELAAAIEKGARG